MSSAHAWSMQHALSGGGACASRVGAIGRCAGVACAVLLVWVLAESARARVSLARELTWQCDEIPLLTRFTGVKGKVANENEARAYQPTFYNWRMGAVRAMRAPHDIASIHTTTNFWVNLTTHLFGVTPFAGRIVPCLCSLLAVATAAYAAWRATGDRTSACATGVLMALSPQLCAHGAEARGYAEAAAFAPLLPLLLETVARSPGRPLRIIASFAVALQLALTVYTAWVYWVLPVLLAACVLLPRGVSSAGPALGLRQSARAALMMLTIGLCCLMGVYTLDRWESLNFAAGVGGLPLHGVSDAMTVASLSAGQMFPVSGWLILLAAPGVGVLWKSPSRWWLYGVLGGAVSMALIAVRQGSAGYPRNLGVLLPPLMVLAGCGFASMTRAAIRGAHALENRFRTSRRLHEVTLARVWAAGALAILAAPAAGGLRARAYELILPDWGRLTLEVATEPEELGPRWFCPCLANHATIHWYRPEHEVDRVLEVPVGGSIEVFLGAALDEFATPVVFRDHSERGAILADPVPGCIAASPVWRRVDGIELRRWQGVRVDPAHDSTVCLPSAEPTSAVANGKLIIAFLELDPAATDEALQRLLSGIHAESQGVVSFKPVRHHDRWVVSLVAPARLVRTIVDVSRFDPAVHAARLRVFQLQAQVDPSAQR